MFKENVTRSEFDFLQERYPIRRRGKETTYKLLEAMTAEELDQNISQLCRVATSTLEKGHALRIHANALQAYRTGKFPDSEQSNEG